MRGLLLVFSLGWNRESRAEDRWFSADKAKHFFTAAFVQSVSFSALRSTGASRGFSLAGATAVSAAVSIGKEIVDARGSGTPSAKDLVWDGAGILAASALLQRTEH
ncbi:MAG TPA: hypothetical protein VIP11_02390 [Gemmatimonadaceae bacterium]